MGLIGKDEIVVDVPHEEGTTFTFRLLSGPELDQAQETEQKRQLRMLREMEPEVIERIMNRAGKEKSKRTETYDKDTLIAFGLIAWTYPEDCTDDNKTRLDAQTRDWTAAEVIKMNTRSAGEGLASDEVSALAASPQD